jgi:hypothetical protein
VNNRKERRHARESRNPFSDRPKDGFTPLQAASIRANHFPRCLAREAQAAGFVGGGFFELRLRGFVFFVDLLPIAVFRTFFFFEFLSTAFPLVGRGVVSANLGVVSHGLFHGFEHARISVGAHGWHDGQAGQDISYFHCNSLVLICLCALRLAGFHGCEWLGAPDGI